MQLTLKEAEKRSPNGPKPVPLEYAGRWIAWNMDRTNIVAHSANLGELGGAAMAAGCPQPLIQRVLDSAFVGSEGNPHPSAGLEIQVQQLYRCKPLGLRIIAIMLSTSDALSSLPALLSNSDNRIA
jgi:hypothetical protein